jgi:hypothetical protein
LFYFWKQSRPRQLLGWKGIGVAEMKFTEFKPRWMWDLNAEDQRILGDTPSVGSLVEISPRINARLLPFGGANKLSDNNSRRNKQKTIVHGQPADHFAMILNMMRRFCEPTTSGNRGAARPATLCCFRIGCDGSGDVLRPLQQSFTQICLRW